MKTFQYFSKEAGPAKQLVGLVFFVLFGFIFSVGVQLLFPNAGGDTPGSIRSTLLLQCLSQLLVFFLPALLFAKCYGGSFQSFFRLETDGAKWRTGLVAACVVLLYLPANDWVSYWNTGWDFGAADERIRAVTAAAQAATVRMLSLPTGWDLVLQLVTVALVPALCEELFFRGVLQQTLGRWCGNAHVAIVVTALLFSVAHGDLLGLVPRFILGLLLGYLFYCSGSMVVNMCAHFFNNALVVVAYFLFNKGTLPIDPADPLLLPWTVAVPCLLAAGLLFYVYIIAPARQKKS